MHKILLITAATLAIGFAFPALAEPGKADPPGQQDGGYNGNGNHNGWGEGAPLPLAGAGLLALAGGALLIARIRKSANK